MGILENLSRYFDFQFTHNIAGFTDGQGDGSLAECYDVRLLCCFSENTLVAV